jgi:hypothetical protein
MILLAARLISHRVDGAIDASHFFLAGAKRLSANLIGSSEIFDLLNRIALDEIDSHGSDALSPAQPVGGAINDIHLCGAF